MSLYQSLKSLEKYQWEIQGSRCPRNNDSARRRNSSPSYTQIAIIKHPRINATIEGGTLLSRGYLIFRRRMLSSWNLMGLVKTRRPESSPGTSFFSHFSLSSSRRSAIALAKIQSSFRPRSNLTSIKSPDPYQFSGRLMTKRRRRPPASLPVG